MKKAIYLFIIFSFFFMCCKKKEEIDFSQYKGSAKLLGTDWLASKVDFALSANNTITFELFKYNELDELRNSMVLSNLNVSKDTIFLKYFKSSANWVTDSIVPTARFYTHLSDGGLSRCAATHLPTPSSPLRLAVDGRPVHHGIARSHA